MDPNSWSELAEIIRQIDGAERIQSQKISKDCQDLLLFVDQLSHGDLEVVDQTINQLLQDPSRKVYTRFVDREPYIFIALALAYCIKGDSVQSEQFAHGAKERFGRSKSDWNKAVSHWLLGMVYWNNGVTGKDRAELEIALKIFSRILKNLDGDLSKGRSDYELTHLCNLHIASLQVAIEGLPEIRVNTRFIDPATITYDLFSSILGLLEIPNSEPHFEWLQSVCLLQPSDLEHINEQIDFSLEILNEEHHSGNLTSTLATLFLAHCYMLAYLGGDANSLSYAIIYAKDASEGFHSLKLDQNEALSKWYMALIHYKISETELALAQLHEADHCLQVLLENRSDEDVYEDISNIRKDIQFWINPNEYPDTLSAKKPQQPKPSQRLNKKGFPPLSWLGGKGETKSSTPQPTPFRKSAFTTPQPRLTGAENKSADKEQQPKERKTSGARKDRIQRQHIIIPVDVQTLHDMNTDSVPLESSLFANLRDYQGRIGDSNAGETPNVDPPPEPSPIRPPKIPSFPIFGHVAAGPAGSPNVGSEEQTWVDPIFEDLCVNIYGIEYNVRFLEKQEYHFVSSKSYGWLRVNGESMNNFSPVKIKDGDYVLFVENRDIDSCVFKAVVAELQDRDQQPVQLVVKELLKLTTRFPSRTDGFSPEYSKYVLHSESTFKIDPNTGEEYKDIEIARDEQIVGEVIAVASSA